MGGAVVSAAAAGFWLALVENMRGSSQATAIRARMAVAAPSPIHSPRFFAGLGGKPPGGGTGANGGGWGAVNGEAGEEIPPHGCEVGCGVTCGVCPTLGGAGATGCGMGPGCGSRSAFSALRNSSAV